MQQPPSEAGDGGDVIKRACDQCRSRKIRCDKESPCSNCRIAARTCSSTGLGQKPKEPRQRVLISSQYEKKIDQFGIRLAGIESAIRELTVSVNSNSDSNNKPSPAESHSSQQHAVHASFSSNSGDPTPAAAAPNPFDELDSDSSSDLDDSPYPGTSSMAAHTAQASEFIEHAVQRETWTQQQQQLSTNMRSALASLQQIVGLKQQKKKTGRLGAKREVKFPYSQPIPPGGLKDLPMPPVQTVVSLLREIKQKPPVTFTMICAYIEVDDFTEACRKVYFATDEDFSLATFIIVNAGLYYLFEEKFIVMNENDTGAAELMTYHVMCRANFETGLANLPFFMPQKMESVQALHLGASYSIEASKPTLAWQLNSAACQLSVTLGFHRHSPSATIPGSSSSGGGQPPPQSRPDPLAEKKQAIFWSGYMLDKGLGLRLGRPGVLQDYDISLPKYMPPTSSVIGSVSSSGPTKDPWRAVLEMWIGHAEIQGLAYERLYSAAAMNHSTESRVESARALVSKLNDLIARTKLLQTQLEVDVLGSDQNTVSGGSGQNVHPEDGGQDNHLALITLQMVLKSDEVSHYSTLALIYRAIPPLEPGQPSRFNNECISAARVAFATHQECMAQTSSSGFLSMTYLHWTILYAPFVPFIVIFCHVIETGNRDDLRLLVEFVASLEAARVHSRAVEKLHRMCTIMCDVATMYIEAKGGGDSHAEDADRIMPVGNDFNMYLSQLGLMPPLPPPLQQGVDAGQDAGFGADENMLDASYQAAQLGDWFEGGRYMMGLLEEDFVQLQPEPAVWASHVSRM